jgi:lysozyme family protein
MALFEPAVDITLENEGSALVDDPKDPGGLSRWGISHRSYPTVDIRNLTREDAAQIYRRDWWKYDGIIDQRVANKIFDMTVNMGHAAIYLLQEIVLQIVRPDGIYGEVTEAGVNRFDPNALLTAYKAKLAAHYEAIVAANPAEAKFLAGWLRRANQ